MSLIRIQCVQAHPVPKVVGGGSIPWDPALFARPEKFVERPEEFPPGATVQNGMQGVPLFSCDACGTILAESEIPSHDCVLIEDDDDELAETGYEW